MKHEIDTFECGKNSSLCLTAGEFYLLGKVDNIDISEFDENDELEIKIKVKNVTKLVNGENVIINYKRPCEDSLIKMLIETSQAMVESVNPQLRLLNTIAECNSDKNDEPTVLPFIERV